uniref:Glycerol-3-phosphate acyltransferase 2, mitochondrial n=1 Tax=Calidris pygmaea TaxID=425635 RepID=A0A8C3JQY5_9CHAR
MGCVGSATTPLPPPRSPIEHGGCQQPPPSNPSLQKQAFLALSKLEVFIPFLGKHRPFLGRCCQTCTPKSWVRHLSSLGFRDAIRVTEEDTECWENHFPPPPPTPGFLSKSTWKSLPLLHRSVGTPFCYPCSLISPKRSYKIVRILAEIQAPLSLLMLRLCNWALLKLLNRLFLSVQLHRGQLAMVLRAARTPNVPLVFLSTHKSPLDGLLLSFLLFSQGLGVPRVTVGSQVCSPRLRALLARLGGIFLPSRMEQTLSDQDEGLPGAVLATPLGLGTCLRAACQALRRSHGCARVDFAQPFSLQVWQRGWWPWLLASPRGFIAMVLDTQKAELWSPSPTAATGLGVEEEILVTKLGLHSLSDSVACSAVMAVGITAALLLHKHQELMRDFAWLLEEILLRQRDVGFSGQLRALVQHSLALLQAHLTLYHLAPIGDILVVPEASVVALWELGHHSAAILPTFASEAVGACAIHALLMEMLPFLGVTVGPSGIVLSQDELLRKILELLWLLPPNLLGLQPESERWVCDLAPRPFCSRRPWAGMDFTDSDSDSQDEAPKRCFKVLGVSPQAAAHGRARLLSPNSAFPLQLSEPQGSPGLLLFLCHLLRPVLRTCASAVAFLDRPSWPQPGRTPPRRGQLLLHPH